MTHTSKLMSAFFLTLLVTGCCCAQELRTLEQRKQLFAPAVFKNSQNESQPYRLFTPPHYDSKKKYPLIVYLHGGGGLGNDNAKQLDLGNAYLLDFFTSTAAQARYPSFVVAPQAPEGEGWVQRDTITPTRQLRLASEMISSLEKSYRIDAARIYVAGQSLGGLGTFAMVAEHPKMFAAAVPLCGGADESKAARFVDTPVWAFHGAKDESVPVERSRQMIAAIKKAGGQPKYTEYPDADHTVWKLVVKETELLPWLFAQSRKH